MNTLLPLQPYFPFLAPTPPRTLAVLPFQRGRRVRLSEKRNFITETQDLSEEEEEVDEVLQSIKDRGQEFYIPLGKTSTAQEERADANLDSASSSSEGSRTGNNSEEEEEEEEGADAEESDEDEDEEEDLDADMRNLDDDDDEEMAEPFDDTGEYDGSQFIVDPRELPQ